MYNAFTHLDEFNTAVEVTDVGITTAVPTATIRNKYVVECEFLYADGDNGCTREVLFPEEAKLNLVEFLNFLNRCITKYQDGRFGDDGYDMVEGWSQWAYKTINWPSDPASDGDYDATLTSVRVFYCDGTGQKYNTALQVKDDS